MTTSNGDNGVHSFPEGSWPLDANALATGADNTKDSAGTVLALNDNVTITGTIVAIDPRATHYDDLTIQLTNPVIGVAGPLYKAKIKLHPSQVTKA